MTIIKDQFTGTGIKRTLSYNTPLTKEELIVKRQEFWGKLFQLFLQNLPDNIKTLQLHL
jgi:hypothetical protein